ncbi:MAG TPA: hypothetical protein DCL77_08865 [Prolixibacteraceae bacterium]|jgi:hypothetical protein|nr:hypothetical protein [Prolixibacteraceae bacterium]
MRKVIVISGIVILIAAAVFMGIKYYQKMNVKPVIQTFATKQNPAYKAVPMKSPLIIEIKNTEGFCHELEGKNPIIKQLKGIKEIDELFSKANRFYEFAGDHSGIHNLFKGKSVILSINPTGKNQLTGLFLVQMNDQNESASATEAVSMDLGSAYTITRKSYDNTTIFNAKSADLNFFYACSNDIFMVSEDFILLEQAIRQANSDNLLNNHEFIELYKTIEENAFVNVFINHLTVHQLLSKFVSPEIRKSVDQLKSYSNWSELDLWLKPSEVEMTGYSITKDSTDNYLNIFRNQAAQKMTIEKAIPVTASYFVAINLKNTNNYLDQYEAYIKTNGNYYPREMDLMQFQKKTKTDAIRLFKEIGGTQFAGVYTNINKSNPEQNRFFVAEILDEADAKEKIGKAVSEYSQTGEEQADKLLTKFTVDSKNSFNIYRLPISNMAQSLFGQAFAGINGNYFTLYRKYLIWGDNLPGMKSYLESLISNKTLANDSVYKATIKDGQPKANFYVYGKVPKVYRLKEVLLKPELSANISASEEVIRKFSIFTWQFSVSGNMIQNRINLKYDPNLKEEPQAIWQVKLDAPLAQTPRLVLNHKDLANREMIVCDKANNVYLINKEGSILWQMTVPDPIISEIHQIDIYQNQKFQYIFNTKTQLYVVDRMGNKVGKFPIIFKAMASNGVSVAQYGQNKEYRFFVAGEDKKIYVYDRDGKLIPKWNFQETQGIVTKPIQRYEIEGKDYIVFSDQQNTYFLDRQGKSRDVQPSPFNHSDNPMEFVNEANPRLIATDPTGKIYIQDFTGHTEIKEVGKFNATHRFAAEDLDGDQLPEYLFADGKKLSVFANGGQKLFERSFPDVISETPVVNHLTPGVNRIGVVVKGENKIYLLDTKGANTWGFPLPGNTPFIIGKFNDTSSYFNLLVGSEDGTVVNYKIE